MATRRSTIHLLCGVVLTVACGGESASTTPDAPADVEVRDDAAPGLDASPGLDAPPGLDASPGLDTPPGLDATQPGSDAPADAGPPPVDAAPVDPPDAPTPPRDAGPPVVPDAGRPPRPTIAQMLRRVVHARAYQNHGWTIDGETPDSVGRALASLRPTYVSGLLRIASDETISPEQVGAFNTIRRLVREASPDCQFDVVLNGEQYPTPAALRDKMRDLDAAVGPDAWFFDFYYEAYSGAFRAPLTTAVSWAHDHRQYIGGNTTGDQNVPDSDFAALSPVSHAGRVADDTLDLKRDEIQRLHERGYPVLMHINNDPQFAPTTESCYFMGQSGIARFDWGYRRREQWITSRAQDQADWHFHFMYPVFFPECPLRHSYNAPRDGMMMGVFADLVRRYN